MFLCPTIDPSICIFVLGHRYFLFYSTAFQVVTCFKIPTVQCGDLAQMANIADPDQTAPALWSVSNHHCFTVKECLFQYLELLQYMYCQK